MSSFPLMLMAACLLMTSEPGGCYAYHSVTCEGSVARLNCDEGQVISVLSANYGRHDKTTCSSGRPSSQIQNVHCSRPTGKVAESCNGKHCCTITASNSEFGDPCWGTYKYLDVTYTCRALRRPNEIYSVTCEDSDAHLKCGEGYVISVHRADYGRYDRTTCISGRPSSQTQNTCCSLPTTDTVAQGCNGRRSCSIRASNSVFGDPCWGTYKYLDVTYTCDPPVTR